MAERDGTARLASENDARITTVGKVIRANHLDELPQLINILKGDMSILEDLKLIMLTLQVLFMKENSQGIKKEQRTAMYSDAKAEMEKAA